MQEVNAQMVLKLHQMSGEPIANCSYLLTQTNGDYDLALKILQRILQQREAEQVQGMRADQATDPADDGHGARPDPEAATPQAALDALKNRVGQLEMRLAQLADTLDAMNEKLTVLLTKIAGADESDR